MSVKVITGDCREKLRDLEAASVHCVVTSPPYWGLRDYGLEPLVWGGDASCDHKWGVLGPAHHPGQVPDGKAVTDENAVGQRASSGQLCRRCSVWRGSLGLEPTPELYIAHIVEIFREVKRVMRDDATLWLNLGDCYAASGGTGAQGTRGQRYGRTHTQENLHSRNLADLKPKDLVMMPARVALALQADGWWLRSDIIWAKPNPMPESVTDRPTQAHEHVFLFSKCAKYFYDADAVRETSEMRPQNRFTDGRGEKDAGYAEHRKAPGMTEPNGRNLRNVWEIATAPFPEAHFATFPPKLVDPCIKAGTSEKGCCPECGAPWGREMDRELIGDRTKDRGSYESEGVFNRRIARGGSHPRGDHYHIGWLPSCNCYKPHKCWKGASRCTVLDPFAGAGTVGLVADRLSRDAILIEAKAEYAQMARARLQQDAGMFAEIA